MPYLILNPGTSNEQSFQLKTGANTIGRDMENDIVILQTTLSRRHARIDVTADRVFVTDLQSRNGTFVNDVKIDQREVRNGDLIRCGSSVMRFTEGQRIEKELKSTGASSLGELLIKDSIDIHGTVLRLKQKDETSRSVDMLRVLLKVSELLSSPENIDTILGSTLDLLFAIVDVDRGAIYLLDDKTGDLIPAAVKLAPGLDPNRPFSSRHILNHVLEKGIGVLSSDAVVDTRFAGAASILDQSIHSSMCVPLKCRDKTTGVLYVDNLIRSDLFAEADLEFLSGFANQAAVAIENSRLYRRIEEDAIARNRLLRFFPRAVINKLMESKDLGLGSVDADVTILFSDICSFTETSSTMEPRQVVDLLNDYFPVMAEIVFRHGGTLEKYIGDALMAIWGAPFQDPEDADRALGAAIEMQHALRQLNRKLVECGRVEIHIHIGLNSGTVAAGNIGSADYIQYAAIGDATNVASRVCSAAQRDEVLVSQETYAKLTNKSLPFESLPPTMVKGKDKPLQLHRIRWDLVPKVSSQ
ncbi:MAG: adenylate/guanylate cyclase domain-containing protein [Acidobacteriota bacterium]